MKLKHVYNNIKDACIIGEGTILFKRITKGGYPDEKIEVKFYDFNSDLPEITKIVINDVLKNKSIYRKMSNYTCVVENEEYRSPLCYVEKGEELTIIDCEDIHKFERNEGFNETVYACFNKNFEVIHIHSFGFRSDGIEKARMRKLNIGLNLFDALIENKLKYIESINKNFGTNIRKAVEENIDSQNKYLKEILNKNKLKK